VRTPEVTEGLSAALDAPGYVLLADESARDGGDGGTGVTWRDLRRVPDTAAAAALALLAIGHDERSAARMDARDIDRNARCTPLRGGQRAVDAAARPFLIAQRLVVGGAGPLLSSPRGDVVPAMVRRMAGEALTELGIKMQPWDTERLRPTHRCLLQRGLMVRRSRPARNLEQQPRVSSGPRLCRHGLPGWIEVHGGGVSHSQRLCAAASVEEARPTTEGYEAIQLDSTRTTQRYAIYRDGDPAGELWSVATPRSVVWVQTLQQPVMPAKAVMSGVLSAQS
jgi:hypothetical protein